MHLLIFSAFGLIVGVIARGLVPGMQSGGWLASLTTGVLGAFIGGFAGRAFGWYGRGQIAGFFVSVAGAVGLLILSRIISGRSTST
jgi:uncharacterized membrane protein YeaQ/YmgE (transglycosylase-associated protein family)